MRWFVVVPGALVPAPIAAELPADATPPAFAALLRRAGVAPLQRIEQPYEGEGAAHLGWLWRAFGGSGPVVSAPFAWQALGNEPVGGHLWQAEPVHFALARDHMLVTPLADVAGDEATALRAEAEPLLAAAGARLLIDGGHWFIVFDRAWSLQATPLDAALGESAQERLPQGADAARWRKLLTEVQIAWHHSPVNQRRTERGAAAINGLWLHGGGAAPALAAARFAQVNSDAIATRGWALAAGVPAHAISAAIEEPPFAAATGNASVRTGAAPAAAGVRGDTLLEWRTLFAPFKADDWGAWLQHWQRLARWLPSFASGAALAGAGVELVLCGREHVRQVSIARGDRWKLWRRLSPPAVVSEPMESA